MRTTNFLEKFANSVINTSITLILSAPFYLQWGNSLAWRLSAILLFFSYHLFSGFIPGKRDFGMLLMKSKWEKEPSAWRYIFYSLLYTISFSTLLFYIWFPFDLLLINLLLIQLPMVLITKNTLHGYIANIGTIKKLSKRESG